MDERFKRVEDEYFSLRGRLSSGRITQEQFEAALKDLVIQDEQGRYWMVGADTGQWYLNDGQSWVPAQPPGQRAPPPATLPAYSNAPIGGRRSNPLLLVAAAVIALLAIGVVVLALVSSGRLTNAEIIVTATPPAVAAAPVSSPSKVSSPTLAAVVPTATAIATATAPPSLTATEVAASQTVVPTVAPPTAAVTATSPPTVAPTLPPPTPTKLPTLKPAVLVPTATAAPAATSTPAAPPGVYVTGMRVDPTEPKNLQLLTFYPVYLNTTGAPHNYQLCVELYMPDNLKKSFGITPCANGTVPTGSTELATDPNYRIVRGGECIPLLARAVSIDSTNARVPFLKPDGNVFWFGFQVCP